jgi:outer membrane receptor protein involved in Fe transport
MIKSVLFAASSGLALVSATGLAHAQTASNTSEVVVTASRITASGFSAPTPTTVIGTDAIAKQASPSLFQAITELPSLAGSTGTTVNNNNTSTGATGLSALNMRGLGTIRTLTLLDGQRVVPSNVSGVNDTGLFPQLLVQRVDVVNGGASASWGSDAISGVVNFVTNKHFEGFKANVEASDSTYNDDQSGLFQIAAGKSFLGDRLHVEGDAEYYNSAGAPPDQPGGISAAGRPSYRSGSASYALGGNPAGSPQYVYYPYNAQSTAQGANGLITAGAFKGTAFGPGGATYPYAYGTGCISTTCLGGEQDASLSGQSTLDDPMQRELFYTRVGYDLTSRIEVYGTFNISDVKTSNQPNYGAQKPNLSISCANAYLPAYIANAASCDNPLTGAPKGGNVTFGTLNEDFPAYIDVKNNRSMYRYVFGSDGSFDLFGKSVSFDAYVGHGVNTTDIHIENMTLSPRYNAAIAAVNQGGQIVCSNPVAQAEGCVPWNSFGAVSNSAASFAFMAPAIGPHQHSVQGEDEAAFSVNATPFKDWAGDVSVAAGVEYRQEYYTVTADPYGNGVSAVSPYSAAYPADPLLSTSGNNWYAGNYHDGSGKYTVTEGFVEVGVPLWESATFGKASADGAFRGTNYSTSGYVSTWKAGGTWDTPIEGLRIRGVQSRDIRAPNLAELYAAPVAVNGTVTNPTNLQSVAIYSNTIGNTNLKPEIADNTEVGAVYRPHFVPGLSVSLDYFNITVNDAISSLTAQQIVNLCYQGNTAYCKDVNLTGQTGTANQSYVTVQPFNLASIKTSGLDIEASYRLPLEQFNLPGVVTLRGLVTRTLDYTNNTGIAGQIIQQNAGNNAADTPYWKAYIPESWSYGKWTFTATERVISDGKINPNYITCTTGCPVSTVQHPTTNYNFIPGAVYVDFGGSYDLTKQAQAYFKIDNLSNSIAPPFGSLTIYDVIGRMYRIGFRLNY